jgi:hypothetical protein
VTRSEKLTQWVAQKYKTHPYFDHCQTVALLAAAAAALAYEVGLCHDMLEDQLTTAQELRTALTAFHYDDAETRQILTAVQELTDVFTAEHFPELIKKQRRKQESQRLARIGPLAQTVKYADLIDNAAWIRQNHPEKWERYAQRKQKLLHRLSLGDPGLRHAALQVFNQVR